MILQKASTAGHFVSKHDFGGLATLLLIDHAFLNPTYEHSIAALLPRK